MSAVESRAMGTVKSRRVMKNIAAMKTVPASAASRRYAVGVLPRVSAMRALGQQYSGHR